MSKVSDEAYVLVLSQPSLDLITLGLLDNTHLPVFDVTTPMSWENPARELMGFFPAASPATTTSWQMMDGEGL